MKGTLLAIALTLLLIGSAFAQNTAWDYSTKTDITGKVTETAISGAVVRCSKACEVYFIPDRYTLVEDQNSVLVRFNDKPVKRYGVSRSEDYTALFFSDPMGVLKAIRDNGGYMTVEYKPYQKTPDTVSSMKDTSSCHLKRIEKWEKESPVAEQRRKREAALSACRSGYAEDVCSQLRDEARSYHTKEPCQSHGFVWVEQETRHSKKDAGLSSETSAGGSFAFKPHIRQSRKTTLDGTISRVGEIQCRIVSANRT